MFVDSHRCPECGSTDVSRFTEEIEGVEVTDCVCNDCDCYEPERFFKPVNPKYLPVARKWKENDHIQHVNLPLREDGVRFWRESLGDESRGEIFTNIRPFCDDGTGFEWGYGGSGPTRFALNILENVLREAGYKGAVMEVDNYKGTCYRQVWVLHHVFKDQFITPAQRGGGTIPYQTVLNWLEDHIDDFCVGE